jgi:23S rRNA (guanosine2251-2'-O)-methyltransferase
MGAEGSGLRKSVTEAIDHRVRIPMTGRVASLNVSAAAAVILFELGRRDRARKGGPDSGGPETGDSNRGLARATRTPFPSGIS